jgi:hypothetical protein
VTKRIPLSQGKFALIDDEDFPEVSKHKWFIINGYAGTATSGAKVYLHRFLMNPKKKEQIDHINLDKLDCRRGNMRLCGSAQNHYNKPLISTNTSGYKGVSWDKVNSKWRAQIMVHKKTINLGRYHTKEDAASAYDNAAKKYFGEFSRTNFEL